MKDRCQLCGERIVKGRCSGCGMNYTRRPEEYRLNETRKSAEGHRLNETGKSAEGHRLRKAEKSAGERRLEELKKAGEKWASLLDLNKAGGGLWRKPSGR